MNGMGINICIIDEAVKDAPGWDWTRLAGDRDFPSVVSGLPLITNDPLYDGAFRPIDFPAWRKQVAAVEWPNPGRFETFLDLLEAHPDWWAYYSW